MKKYTLLIIAGGIFLITGLILSLGKKNNVIYYYDEELSQEEASALVVEKVRNIVDVYENQQETFKIVKQTPKEPEEDSIDGESPDLNAPELYYKVSNYDEVINELFTTFGKEELEKISFGDNLFVKIEEDGTYILKEIPENNRYTGSSISVSDVYVNKDEVKAKVAFTSNKINENDDLTYYIYEKDIMLVKKEDKWLVNSFKYTNV